MTAPRRSVVPSARGTDTPPVTGPPPAQLDSQVRGEPIDSRPPTPTPYRKATSDRQTRTGSLRQAIAAGVPAADEPWRGNEREQIQRQTPGLLCGLLRGQSVRVLAASPANSWG